MSIAINKNKKLNTQVYKTVYKTVDNVKKIGYNMFTNG